MPIVRDVTSIVRTRRSVSRARTASRIPGYFLLVIGVTGVVLLRQPASTVEIVIAAVLLADARAMAEGKRQGAVAVLCIGVTLMLLFTASGVLLVAANGDTASLWQPFRGVAEFAGGAAEGAGTSASRAANTGMMLAAIALVSAVLRLRTKSHGARASSLLVSMLGVVPVALLIAVGLLMASAATRGHDAFVGLSGLTVLALMPFMLIRGGAAAIRCREPAAFVGLVRTPHGSATIRFLVPHLWRPGVILPLLGWLVLMTVAVLLQSVSSGFSTRYAGSPARSLYRRARARAALSTPELLAIDHRHPVLYLRSFKDEDLLVHRRWNSRRSLVENLNPFDRLEEVIQRNLATVGPVIAIGDPRASSSLIGAAREWATEQEWRALVLKRMVEASVIVVVAGETDSLAWELSAVVANGALPRLVVVIPGTPEDDRERKLSAVRSALTSAGAPDCFPMMEQDVLVLAFFGEDCLVLSGAGRSEWWYEAALLEAVREVERNAAARQAER